MEQRRIHLPTLELDGVAAETASLQDVLALVFDPNSAGELALRLSENSRRSDRAAPLVASALRLAISGGCRTAADIWPSVAGALVLGGTRGLGLSYAESLVRSAETRTLVLASRGGAVTPTDMERLLDAKEGENPAVFVAAVDARDPASVERLVAWTRSISGPVTLAAQAAGEPSRAVLLEDLTVVDLNEAAAPRLVPLPVLRQFFAHVHLFGSTSAAWSQTGGAAYAAGCAAIEAEETTAPGGRSTPIQFGPFASIGMAAAHTDELGAIGLGSLRPEQAFEAFRTAGGFASDGPLVEWSENEYDAAGPLLVADLDARRFKDSNSIGGPFKLLDEVCGQGSGREGPSFHGVRKLAPTQPEKSPRAKQKPSSSQIRRIVADVASDVLGVPRAEFESTPQGDFPPGAIDSLSAVELSARLGAELGTQLPATVAYDHPSVASLATALVTKLDVCVSDEVDNERGEEKSQCARTFPSQPPSLAFEPEAIPPVQPRRGNFSPPTPTLFATTASRLPRFHGPGSDAVSLVRFDRWDVEGPDLTSESASRASIAPRFAALLEGIERFDAAAFAMSAPEARLLDPQQRLLLETAAEVRARLQERRARSESAPSAGLPVRTSVFVGIQHAEYGGLCARHASSVGPFNATGGSFAVAAGRVSYAFGLKGPAAAIDSACSSALVAVHLGSERVRMQAERSAEQDVAASDGSKISDARAASAGRTSPASLCAGVNLVLSPSTTAAAKAAGMLSPTGRCKALDASADGYVRAEAVVVVALLAHPDPTARRSAFALAGSAVNQDGRSSSLTAPHGPSQTAVLLDGLRDARLGFPGLDLSALELHGTGTALGDPIEIGAARAAHGGRALVLGAGKATLGHAEPASGATGLVRAGLAARSAAAECVPCLRALNPFVSSALGDGGRMQWGIGRGAGVAAESEDRSQVASLMPRLRASVPLVAQNPAVGVSAFAYAGTNAHAVLTRVPDEEVEVAPSRAFDAEHDRAGRLGWTRFPRWFAPLPSALCRRALCASSSDSSVRFSASLCRGGVQDWLLREHQVAGIAVVPAAALLETALAGIARAKGEALGGAAIVRSTVPRACTFSAQLELEVDVHAITGSTRVASARGAHLSGWAHRVEERGVSERADRPPHIGSTHALALCFSSAIRAFSDTIAVLGSTAAAPAGPVAAFGAHPCVVDASTQLAAAAASVVAARDSKPELRIPVAIACAHWASQSSDSDAVDRSAELCASDASANVAARGAGERLTALLRGWTFGSVGGGKNGQASLFATQSALVDGNRAANADIGGVSAAAALRATLEGSASQSSTFSNVLISNLAWEASDLASTAARGPIRTDESRWGVALGSLHVDLPIGSVAAGAQLARDHVLASAIAPVPLLSASGSATAVVPGPAASDPESIEALLRVAGREASESRPVPRLHRRACEEMRTGVVAAKAPARDADPRLAPLDASWSGARLVRSLHDARGVSKGAGFSGLSSVVVTGAAGAIGSLSLAWAAPLVQSVGLCRRGRMPKGGVSLAAWSVTLTSCDVASHVGVAHLELPQRSLLLHAAGTAADSSLARLAPADLCKSAAGKSLRRSGRLLGRMPDVRGVVGFGSLAAVLGSRGQSAYASANASLSEGLRKMRAEGIPAATIAWGAWSLGMARGNGAATKAFASAGIIALSPSDGLHALGVLLESGFLESANVGDVVVARMAEEGAPAMAGNETPAASSSSKPRPALEEISRPGKHRTPLPFPSAAAPFPSVALPPDAGDHLAAVLPGVLAVATDLLGATPSPDETLQEAGLDSIASVEFRDILSARFGVELPATLVFDHPTSVAVSQAVFAAMGPLEYRHGVESGLQPAGFDAQRHVNGEHASEELGASEDTQQLVMRPVEGNRVDPVCSPGSNASNSFQVPHGDIKLAEFRPHVAQVEPRISSIVAVSGRFPVACSSSCAKTSTSSASPVPACSPPFGQGTTAFLQPLGDGPDLQAEVPLQRWDADRLWAPRGAVVSRDALYARHAACVDRIDEFDAAAFGIPPSEAAALDPQIRVLIEESSVALAGMTERSFETGADRIAVFSGAMYHEHAFAAGPALRQGGGPLPPALLLGSGGPYLVGRIARAHGLAGPTAFLDTACSSSLVALHLASLELRFDVRGLRGALVTGSNAMLDPSTPVGIAALGALSEVGRCRSFDAAADGYGRGESFVAIVLDAFAVAAEREDRAAKTLTRCSQALLILGSAVNVSAKSGALSAPHGPTQSELIKATLLEASEVAQAPVVRGEVRDTAVDAISVHGTGTALGDPIESGAVAGALSGRPNESAPVHLLSSKAVFGHTEGAAGLTGALLAAAATHATLASQVRHLRTLNPHVAPSLEAKRSSHRLRSPGWNGARLPRERGPLATSRGAGASLVAGTSSFGMSGVNAHALLCGLVNGIAGDGDVHLGRTTGVDRFEKSTTLMPFERTRRWHLPPRHPLVAKARSGDGTAVFELSLADARYVDLHHHRVLGSAVLPGAASLSAAHGVLRALASERQGDGALGLCDVAFPSSLRLDDAAVVTSVLLSVDELGRLRLATPTAPGSRPPALLARACALRGHAASATVAVEIVERAREPVPWLAGLVHDWSRSQGLATAEIAPDPHLAFGRPAWPAGAPFPAARDASLHLAAGAGAETALAVPAVVGLSFESDCDVSVACMPAHATAIGTGNLNGSAIGTSWLGRGISSRSAMCDWRARPLRSPRNLQDEDAAGSLFETLWMASEVDESTGQVGGKGDACTILGFSKATTATVNGRLSVSATAAVLQALDSAGGARATLERLTISEVDRSLPCGMRGLRLTAASAATLAALRVAAAELNGLPGIASAKMQSPYARKLTSAVAPAAGFFDPTSTSFVSSRALSSQARLVRPRLDARRIPPSGAGIVVGGAGALGSLVVAWWAGHQPGDVGIVSRSWSEGPRRDVEKLSERDLRFGRARSIRIHNADASAKADDALVSSIAGSRISPAPELPMTLFGCNGVVRDASWRRVSPSALRATFASKRASIADGCCSQVPVRSTWLFSSTASLLAPRGQAAYAAANAHLEAIAKAARTRGEGVAAIAWGAWKTGMAAADDAILQRMEAGGVTALLPEQGASLLERLVHSCADIPAVTVAAAFVWPNLARAAGGALPVEFELVAQSVERAESARRALSGEEVRPLGLPRRRVATRKGTPSRLDRDPRRSLAPPRLPTSLLPVVLETLHNRLRVAPAPDVPLASLGLDSLGAVEVSQDLSRRLGKTFPPTLAFDHPTAADLASALEQALGQGTESGERESDQAGMPVDKGVDVGGAWESEGRFGQETDDCGRVAVEESSGDEAQTSDEVAPPFPARSFVTAHRTPLPLLLLALRARLPLGERHSDAHGAPFTSDLSSVATAFASGIEASSEQAPASRWDADREHDPSARDATKSYARSSAFLADVISFDASVFGMTSAEAAAMDPQQRGSLAIALDGFEAAGWSRPGKRPASVATFLGVMHQEWFAVAAGVAGAAPPPVAVTASGGSFASGRIAFALKLGGAAGAVDTACSSSLVALRLAANELVDTAQASTQGALALGANAMLSPHASAAVASLAALSPAGRCQALDAAADGYGRAEGFACVAVGVATRSGSSGGLRKPVAVLLAVRVATAAAAGALTSPHGPAQAALLRAATLECGANAVVSSSLHGTGTPLGDPIELGALASATQGGRGTGSINLSASKASAGHSEGAAGLVALMMALGSLDSAVAMPNPLLRAVNPYAAAALVGGGGSSRRLAPARTLGSLCVRDGSVATTSSFGMSGINAVAVVGQASGSAKTLRAVHWKPNHSHLLPCVTPGLRASAAGPPPARAGPRTRSITISVDLCSPRLAALDGRLTAGAALALAASSARLLRSSDSPAATATFTDLVFWSGRGWKSELSQAICQVDPKSGDITVGYGVDSPTLMARSSAVRGGAAASKRRTSPRRDKIPAGLVHSSDKTSSLSSAFVCFSVAPAAALQGAEGGDPASDWSVRAAALAEALLRGSVRTNSCASSLAVAAASVGLAPAPGRALFGVRLDGRHARAGGVTLTQPTSPARLARRIDVDSSHLHLVRGVVYDVEHRAAAPAACGTSSRSTSRFSASLRTRSATLTALRSSMRSALPLRFNVNRTPISETRSLAGTSMHPELSVPSAVQGLVGTAAVELPHLATGSVHSDSSSCISIEAVEAAGDARGDGTVVGARVAHQARLVAIGAQGGRRFAEVAQGSETAISGGTSGIGLLCAVWSGRSGSGGMQLFSRSGRVVRDAAEASAAAGLVNSSFRVTATASDASSSAGVRALHPNAVLLHAAGVQVGGSLAQSLGPAALRATAAPKSRSWVVCTHASGRPDPVGLASVALFSSVSSLVGFSGHADYAAANVELDAAAAVARQCGLPAASIRWGAWSAIGMVARSGARQRVVDASMVHPEVGLGALTWALGLSALGTPYVAPEAYWSLLKRGDTRGVLEDVPEAPEDERDATERSSASRPAKRLVHDVVGSGGRPDSIEALAPSPTALLAEVAEITARVLGREASAIDLDAPLATQGLDSLAGLELKHALQERDAWSNAALEEDLGGATLRGLVSVVAGATGLTDRGESVAMEENSIEQDATTISILGTRPEANDVTSRSSGTVRSTKGTVRAPALPYVSPAPVRIRLRVFCVAFQEEEDAFDFGAWRATLPAATSLVSVTPRRSVACERGLPAAISCLFAHLSLRDETPYALVGCGSASILARELAADVEASRSAPPAAFVAVLWRGGRESSLGTSGDALSAPKSTIQCSPVCVLVTETVPQPSTAENATPLKSTLVSLVRPPYAALARRRIWRLARSVFPDTPRVTVHEITVLPSCQPHVDSSHDSTGLAIVLRSLALDALETLRGGALGTGHSWVGDVSNDASSEANTRDGRTPLRSHAFSSMLALRTLTPPAPALRVFCLPYAGGVSENVYARWAGLLPAGIHVCPIEIPGRGRLRGTPAVAGGVLGLAHLLARSLPLGDAPYVFFGTCLGAIVAYETCREVYRLREDGMRTQGGGLGGALGVGCADASATRALRSLPRAPSRLMVAAVAAPEDYARAVARLYLQRRMRSDELTPRSEVLRVLDGWQALPRDVLIKAFEAGNFAGVEEMRKNDLLFDRVAPLGVADIRSAVTYGQSERSVVDEGSLSSRWSPELAPGLHAPLPVPITAFEGAADKTVARGSMRRWARRTTHRFERVVVRGGDHYLVTSQLRVVVDLVARESLEALREEEEVARRKRERVVEVIGVRHEGDRSSVGRSEGDLETGRALYRGASVRPLVQLAVWMAAVVFFLVAARRAETALRGIA